MKIKISRSGSIRIPATLRWALDLQPGDELFIESINGPHLLVSKLVSRSPWGEVKRLDPERLTPWRLAVDRVALRRRHSPALPWNDPEQTYLKR